MSESQSEYLTVSQAAARLGISERTVQRRCKSGKLAAKLATTDDGNQWLIDPATLPTGDDTNDTTADTVTTPDKEAIHAQNGTNPPKEAATGDDTADKVPTGAAIGADTVLLDQLRDENVFLRAQIDAWRLQAEAANRTASETSAALRKALDQLPKAITAGEKLEQVGTENQSREDAPQTATTNASQTAPAPPRADKRQKLTRWQRAAARILGIR